MPARKIPLVWKGQKDSDQTYFKYNPATRSVVQVGCDCAAPPEPTLQVSTIVTQSNIGFNDMMYDGPDTLIVMNAGGPDEIKKVSISTGTITALTSTLSGSPYSAFLSGNDIYVAGNTIGNSVYKVDKTTGTSTPFISFGGPPQFPYAITWDNVNTIFVSLQISSSIRKFNKTTGSAITPSILGTLQVQSLAYDPINNCLYGTCTFNHLIQKYDLTTNTVTTFAGTGVAGYSNGNRLVSQFRYPHAICYIAGQLLIGDANCVIRKIDISTGDVTLVAGTPGVAGNTDGPALSSTFPSSIFSIVPVGSDLYVLTSNGIRKVFFA